MNSAENGNSIENILITKEIIRSYICRLCIQYNASILKIGIGEGINLKNFLKHSQEGSLLTIDTYQPLIDKVRNEQADCPQIQIENMHIKEMSFNKQFDFIFSFLCPALFFTSMEKYLAMYKALKPGGELFIILPSGSSPISGTYRMVQRSGEFPEIKSFKLMPDLNSIVDMEQEVSRIPFSSFKIETPNVKVNLKKLQNFRKILEKLHYRYLPFVPPEIVPKIHDAQTREFDKFCQTHYNGKYIFEYAPYIVLAQK